MGLIRSHWKWNIFVSSRLPKKSLPKGQSRSRAAAGELGQHVLASERPRPDTAALGPGGSAGLAGRAQASGQRWTQTAPGASGGSSEDRLPTSPSSCGNAGQGPRPASSPDDAIRTGLPFRVRRPGQLSPAARCGGQPGTHHRPVATALLSWWLR